jgi:hypothetical protein
MVNRLQIPLLLLSTCLALIAGVAPKTWSQTSSSEVVYGAVLGNGPTQGGQSGIASRNPDASAARRRLILSHRRKSAMKDKSEKDMEVMLSGQNAPETTTPQRIRHRASQGHRGTTPAGRPAPQRKGHTKGKPAKKNVKGKS